MFRKEERSSKSKMSRNRKSDIVDKGRSHNRRKKRGRKRRESESNNKERRCDNNDNVIIRRVNLLMLIHERNCLINSLQISDPKCCKMSEASKCDRNEMPDIMYGCRVCKDAGGMWLGKNAQVLTTHYNTVHKQAKGEYNLITHQYHEQDKSVIKEWLNSKNKNGARPKVTAKTPNSKEKRPVGMMMGAVGGGGKAGESLEASVSGSASGYTPNCSQESQLSSQAFSPGATSTKNASGIDATITIGSSDSSNASSEGSVKVIEDTRRSLLTSARKRTLDRVSEESEDDEDSKKQRLDEDDIDEFSFDSLHKGLKEANRRKREDMARQEARMGATSAEEARKADTDALMAQLLNDSMDALCYNVLNGKDVFNEESSGAEDTADNDGTETRKQNEMLDEIQVQLRGKQEELESLRAMVEERDYQIVELKTAVKRKDLAIEQLNEKLKRNEEVSATLDGLGGNSEEGKDAILKKMCKELVNRKNEIVKLKGELQSETGEKDRMRKMYEQANNHATLLTGNNKQMEAEVKEIRRSMICPQVKEGGWCQLPQSQCDYRHPPPKSEQPCKWNFPKHASMKPKRCPKSECEYKHDPNIQKTKKPEEEKSKNGSKVTEEMDMDVDGEKQEEAEKKKRIEERRKKRAARKMTKNGGRQVSNKESLVPKNLTKNLPGGGAGTRRYTQPPPQAQGAQVQYHNQVLTAQAQAQVQPVLMQQIPILPQLQPRDPSPIQGLPEPVPAIMQNPAVPQPQQPVRDQFSGQLDRMVNDSVNQGGSGFEISWRNAPPPFPVGEGRTSVQRPPSRSTDVNNPEGRGQGQQPAQMIPNYNAQRIQIRQEIEREKEMYRLQREEEERVQQQSAMLRQAEDRMLYQRQINQVQAIQEEARQYLPQQQQQPYQPLQQVQQGMMGQQQPLQQLGHQQQQAQMVHRYQGQLRGNMM